MTDLDDKKALSIHIYCTSMTSYEFSNWEVGGPLFNQTIYVEKCILVEKIKL